MKKKEIRVQLALGTYKYWYIEVTYEKLRMSDSALRGHTEGCLEKAIPKYIPAQHNSGFWFCIASDQQIDQFYTLLSNAYPNKDGLYISCKQGNVRHIHQRLLDA